jgi:hypothetical protein
MAYYGEELNHCKAVPFNFHFTYIVIVSGDGWNPCGHSLINTGGPTGFYFHVAAEPPAYRNRPKYMDADGYARYLQDTGKRELRRQYVPIKKPHAAHAKLDQLLIRKWQFGLVPNNCAAFVEEILRAGGSHTGIYLNCPSLGKRW